MDIQHPFQGVINYKQELLIIYEFINNMNKLFPKITH